MGGTRVPPPRGRRGAARGRGVVATHARRGRRAHGRVAADGEAPAPAGETTNTVVHVATIALPAGSSDFASDSVDQLGRTDALIVLFEYDREAASEPLFAKAGLPRVLQPSDFNPSVLQRSVRGQAGVQVFFHEGDRAFCLYVVLGSYDARADVVPEVNKVLSTMQIDGGTPAPVKGTVLDAIKNRADWSTFAALLASTPVATTLAGATAVTVFAPLNAQIPDATLTALRADPDLLQRTLLQHVVPESIPPGVLPTRPVLSTMAGGALTVTSAGGVQRRRHRHRHAGGGGRRLRVPAVGHLRGAEVNTLAGPLAIAAVLLAAGGVAKVRTPLDTARALQGVGIGATALMVRVGAAAEVVLGVLALSRRLARRRRARGRVVPRVRGVRRARPARPRADQLVRVLRQGRHAAEPRARGDRRRDRGDGRRGGDRGHRRVDADDPARPAAARPAVRVPRRGRDRAGVPGVHVAAAYARRLARRAA